MDHIWIKHDVQNVTLGELTECYMLREQEAKCPIISQTFYKLNLRTLKTVMTIKRITYGMK